MTALLLLVVLAITLPISLILGAICGLSRERRATRWLLLPVFHIVMVVVLALLCRQLFFLDEPMAAAARSGDYQEVEYWLDRGASPNGSFDGVPAIKLAREGDHEDIVRLLKARGAND